jgi:hypothetical protein
MIKYQIQTCFYPDEWDAVDDEFFDTLEAAQAELKELIDDMDHAVKMGFLQDSNPNDWRVAKIESL